MQELERRRSYLIGKARDVIREHEIWSKLPDVPGIGPQIELHRELNAAIEAYEIGDLPHDCRPLHAIFMELAPLWRKYVEQADVTGEYAFPPPAEFWTVFRQLAAAVAEASYVERGNIESLQELKKQKVKDAQIAVMYGWLTPRGEPDVARVAVACHPSNRKEGTPWFDGVPNPDDVRRRNAREAAERKMEEALEQQAERAAAMEQVAPESIEELIAQRVSPQQIARMKGMLLTELEEYATTHGLTLPDSYELTTKTAPPEISPELAALGLDLGQAETDEFDDDSVDDDDDAEDAPASMLSLEEEILAAHRDDPTLTPGAIAEMLDTTPQKVTAVIKRQHEIATSRG